MTQDLIFEKIKFKLYPRDEVDESVIAEIFKWREYRCVEEILKTASGNIIDAGAHIGIFALYCRALNPMVKIFCLEPEPNNFKLLTKHIKQNKIKDIVLKNVALAKATSQRGLLISKDNHNHRLLAGGGRTENTDDQKILTVMSYGLADFCRVSGIEKISLLKMDIEGGEYEIINGLKPNDFTLIENLILEYHDQGAENHRLIENKLRPAGFSVQTFPSQFDKKMGFILGRNKK